MKMRTKMMRSKAVMYDVAGFVYIIFVDRVTKLYN